jgi:hypothetical protein
VPAEVHIRLRVVEPLGIDSKKGSSLMVGLPGFEPGSIEPKSTSLDQASRQPRDLPFILKRMAEKDNFASIIKTLAKHS